MIDLIILTIMIVVALYLSRMLFKKREIYDPFALWLMVSHCRCRACKMEFLKTFERFEYVFQKKKMKCPVCLSESTIEILGIFSVRVKTPLEEKWEALEDKWR